MLKQSILMILKLLLNTHMLWMMFVKTLNNTIKKTPKKLVILDYIITGMLSNNKHNPIVTELFIRGKKLNISSCFYYTILFSCAKNC